jgi:hypothetical protein
MHNPPNDPAFTSPLSFPAVAQSLRATSLKITCTLCAVPPQFSTKADVTTSANRCFCSLVLPSNISTRMTGMDGPSPTSLKFHKSY